MSEAGCSGVEATNAIRLPSGDGAGDVTIAPVGNTRDGSPPLRLSTSNSDEPLRKPSYTTSISETITVASARTSPLLATSVAVPLVSAVSTPPDETRTICASLDVHVTVPDTIAPSASRVVAWRSRTSPTQTAPMDVISIAATGAVGAILSAQLVPARRTRSFTQLERMCTHRSYLSPPKQK